ncbi:SDR family oxidoreductase [Kitasatospora sp. NPDC059571]|uniref:SDR family oxidoreductase n=1 Tax=Kitasatospora sp. NPDC059571 TaxID=3346871 RepID=UPI0036CDC5ED
MPRPTDLVLGATGFLGRWLVLELLDRGHAVAAGLRGGPARAAELRRWLAEHGADDARLTALTCVGIDTARPGLGLSDEDAQALTEVRDVHNLAARYAFGLSRAEAEAANVDGAVHPLRWAAGLPRLRRLVHVSGYRVGRTATPVHPMPREAADRLYRTLGAYEASKTEGDAAVRTLAPRLGVPLTVVNPGVVIGHSRTGEAGQYIGLAPLVERLAAGRLPALAGSRRTFVPVVAVDHLAALLAAAPGHDTAPVQLHTVLDPATPPLPELVAVVARALGVRAPRSVLPAGLVRRLPQALTGLDRESFTFLSEDRYDTASAERLAASAGLSHPPVEELLGRWAVRLVAERAAAQASATRG